jgi:hypothetical protein
MSILHDTMNGVFNAIFGPIYDDGYLKRATYSLNQELRDRYPNGEPVKLQKDNCTEAQRGQNGYSDRDVRFIMLSDDLDGAPTTDDVIEYKGTDWSIRDAVEDATGSHWTIRASPKKSRG